MDFVNVLQTLTLVIQAGENCYMPDWFEAKLVAMMVLLAADVEGMKSQYR